eukprot:6212369-Pleurochrysis_carterae.AAC.5
MSENVSDISKHTSVRTTQLRFWSLAADVNRCKRGRDQKPGTRRVEGSSFEWSEVSLAGMP